MKKATVYAAWVNGTWTELKAYKKGNALKRFQQLDANVKLADIKKTTSINSHQEPVETAYPELFA